MKKVHVRVNICGVECGICSDESQNYVYSVADEINEAIQKIKFSNPGISRSMADILVMMKFCDENRKLLKEKSEIEKLCKELEAENKKLREELGETGAKHKSKK